MWSHATPCTSAARYWMSLTSANLRANAWKEQERLRGIQAMNAGEALTAAEQRNAELVKSIESINASASTAHVSQSLWKLKTVMASIARITDAALKPTESGASEPQCCDLFPKCYAAKELMGYDQR